MENTIVLVTGGKNEDVDWVKVKLFELRSDAEKYCKEYTDNPMDKKYWRYAEIIEQDHTYEVDRYANYY